MSVMTARSDLVWESRQAPEMCFFAYHTPGHSQDCLSLQAHPGENRFTVTVQEK